MAPLDVTYATAPRIATALARARHLDAWPNMTLLERNNAVARVLENNIWPDLLGANRCNTPTPSPAPCADSYPSDAAGNRPAPRRFSPASSGTPSLS